MGPIWGRQDPGGPLVGPMNFAIWVCSKYKPNQWKVNFKRNCSIKWCEHQNIILKEACKTLSHLCNSWTYWQVIIELHKTFEPALWTMQHFYDMLQGIYAFRIIEMENQNTALKGSQTYSSKYWEIKTKTEYPKNKFEWFTIPLPKPMLTNFNWANQNKVYQKPKMYFNIEMKMKPFWQPQCSLWWKYLQNNIFIWVEVSSAACGTICLSLHLSRPHKIF